VMTDGAGYTANVTVAITGLLDQGTSAVNATDCYLVCHRYRRT
jgi:hypothetical protein